MRDDERRGHDLEAEDAVGCRLPNRYAGQRTEALFLEVGGDGLSRAREALKRFDVGSRIEGLSMSLNVRGFPEWFDRLPFSSGAQVWASCDQAELTDTGRKIRDAFDRLTSVCPELNGQGE